MLHFINIFHVHFLTPLHQSPFIEQIKERITVKVIMVSVNVLLIFICVAVHCFRTFSVALWDSDHAFGYFLINCHESIKLCRLREKLHALESSILAINTKRMWYLYFVQRRRLAIL